MFDFDTILKPNATPFEQAMEQGIRVVKPDLTSVRTLMNPDTCPAHLLAWLAWTFSVDVWDPSWPEETKRAVIKRAIVIHRRKGTVGAVRRALDTLGYEIQVSEWFDNGGAPHTFRVVVNAMGAMSRGAIIGPDIVDEIESVIENVKPVRSHYDVNLNVTVEGRAHVGAFQRTAMKITALPLLPSDVSTITPVKYAVIAITHMKISVGG